MAGNKFPRIMAAMDRLSALPDDILSHILSFIPLKMSVSTSILARRWRFVWAYVPNLEFIEDEPDYEPELIFGKRFIDMMNMVMPLYKAHSVNTFRLHMQYCDEGQIETCIKSVIARNVKNLDLSFCYDGGILPCCIFTCKTLVVLRLEYCDIRKNEDVLCLPALKKLHLKYVRFYESDESLLPHLLSGCPVLEELIVNRDFGDDQNMVCCYISSLTIKRLVLISEYPNLLTAHRLKIDTPSLRHLQLHDRMSENFSAGVLASLIEADVEFYCGEPNAGNALYSRSVIEFVGKLYNVKWLKLSSGCVKVPALTFSDLIIKFRNLTKIELAADWRFLSYFLEKADNLEVLIIVNKVDSDLKYWIEPLQVPKCLLWHLRSVRIVELGCTEHELDMVGYLLRNAKVLERMEIYFQEEHSDALKRISSFERGSEACKLDFY